MAVRSPRQATGTHACNEHGANAVKRAWADVPYLCIEALVGVPSMPRVLSLGDLVCPGLQSEFIEYAGLVGWIEPAVMAR